MEIHSTVDTPKIIYAYIDEEGDRGYVRDLLPSDDEKFGIMVALVFGTEFHDTALGRFTPGFQRFQQAAPSDAKLHITEAFKSGNEQWAEVAKDVREEFLSIILETRPCIIYAARRFKLSRLEHDRNENLKKAASMGRKSAIKIVGSNRPSDAQIEDDLIISLSLLLDTFAEQGSSPGSVYQVNLLFDETDSTVAKRYQEQIQKTRELSSSTKSVKGWDPKKSRKVAGKVQFTIKDADFPLDTKYLGNVEILGKDHAFILTVDIVANHLFHHLRNLQSDVPLKSLRAIADWHLRERVWGNSDNAIDDLINASLSLLLNPSPCRIAKSS